MSIVFDTHPDALGAGVLLVHFDIDEHALPLHDFIASAYAAKEIIDSLNDEFFDGKLQYELIVIPPEAGSFKSKLKIVIVSGALVVSTALMSDAAVGFTKGLTGHTPSYWAEQVGTDIRETFSDNDEEQSEKIKNCAAIILTQSTVGFLEKSPAELIEIKIDKETFIKAYNGKNEFYESCIKNEDIKSIGFDDTNEFPIKRDDFASHIVEIPELTEEENLKWIISIQRITVTSPNWEREDTSRRWRCINKEGKHVSFSMEDDTFWQIVKTEQIQPKIKDSMEVQWAYVLKGKQPTRARVFRVIDINGLKISSPLPEGDIRETLDTSPTMTPELPDLFIKQED